MNSKSHKNNEIKKIAKQIKKLRPDEKEKLIENIFNDATYEQRTFLAKQQFYQGALPFHEHFASYEKTLPGAADRILKLTEKESDHVHNLENRIVNSELKKEWLGMIFGFIISIAAIVAGTICIMNGKSVAGTIMSGFSLVPLVSLFVKKRRK